MWKKVLNKFQSTKWTAYVFAETVVTVMWILSSLGKVTGAQAVTFSGWENVTIALTTVYMGLNIAADKFPNMGWSTDVGERT